VRTTHDRELHGEEKARGPHGDGASKPGAPEHNPDSVPHLFLGILPFPKACSVYFDFNRREPRPPEQPEYHNICFLFLAVGHSFF
jgi:hypothetical protein